MFYYSKRSHRKIVHTKKCYIAGRFPLETKGTFATLHDAFSDGYRLCRHCNPIIRQYRKEEDDILDYCLQNGMSCHCSDRNFIISSTVSKWQITVSSNGKTILHHKNAWASKSEDDSSLPGYHEQGVSFATLMEYLRYVKDHDSFRDTRPYQIKEKATKRPAQKGTKRWRKEQKAMKEKARRRSAQNVIALINSLE